MKKLEGKVAIVTGGGGAIGRAICLHLAEAGAKVAVFDLTVDSTDKVAKELLDKGCEAAPFPVDITNYEAVASAVDEVGKKLGQVSILVNCAGGSAREKLAEYYTQSLDVIHWILNVNLFGALYCIRAVAPIMVKAEEGTIVNVTSIVARGGKKKQVEYGAAKGGIIAATKSLALELGRYNINVNCVSPGLVSRDKLDDEKSFAHRFSCMNRVCTQDDVARAVLFLALPDSDFITGQDLAIDGGRSLGLKGD
ncbi:MAG: SDR family oxidoreductase [Planctomycetes bacterium]|nr:SDR family oxidoreductase [Planctomycetota bacterium]